MAARFTSCRWTRTKKWHWQVGACCPLGTKQRCAKAPACCSIEKNGTHYSRIKTTSCTNCLPLWVFGQSFIYLSFILLQPLPFSPNNVQFFPCLCMPYPLFSVWVSLSHTSPKYILKINLRICKEKHEEHTYAFYKIFLQPLMVFCFWYAIDSYH